MTTRTPPLPSVDADTERSSHPLLSVVLPTALTLAAVLSLGVWLFRDRGPGTAATTPAEEQSPATVSQVLTGQERGGLAEMQEDLGGQRLPLPPYVVYLVANAEQQQAMIDRGLTEGETVLVAGTPEEEATAYTLMELLAMYVPPAPVARGVRVIDLRPSPGPAATAPVPALGSPAAAAGTVSDQEMYNQWLAGRPGAANDAPHPRHSEVVQIVYLAGSAEQAEPIRQGIAEADATRAELAAPPFTVRATVLVIAAGEEAQILRALADSDAIRDNLGLPGLMVVDLRTPA